MTAILGLNAYHGDAAAALVVDGELVAAAEEERFNRVKHCAGFPALAAALVPRGRRPRRRRARPRRDRPRPAREPRARSSCGRSRHGASVALPHARGSRTRRRCATSSASSPTALGVDEADLRARFHNVEHHQAHVASAFFVSPFDEAAILSVDGFGDFASTMLADGRGNRFEVLDRVALPALARDLLHGGHAVARLPALRRRGQGDGPRAVRRAGATCDADARRSCSSTATLFELDLDYFTHHTEGVDMTWDDGLADDRPDLLGPARRAARPARASRGAELDRRATRTSPRRCRRCSRRRTSTSSAPLQERTRLADALPRRRRRAERGRERADPPRDAVRGALHPAGRGRLGHRGRRRLLRLEPGARTAARLRHGARLHRARVHATPRSRPRSRAAGARRRERLDDDELFADRRRADRRGRRRRLVPGPDGVRAARARQPLDRRRPAPRTR